MQFLFDLYPNLKALYRRKVPEEIDEKTFWAQVTQVEWKEEGEECVRRHAEYVCLSMWGCSRPLTHPEKVTHTHTPDLQR